MKDTEQAEEEYRDVMAKKSYCISIYIPVIIAYIVAIAVYAYVVYWSKNNGASEVPHNPKIHYLNDLKVSNSHYIHPLGVNWVNNIIDDVMVVDDVMISNNRGINKDR